jgi:hypothetical protein
MRHKRKGRMMVVGSEDLLWDMFGKWSNKMNDSVSNEQTELLADIESKMSEAELRFARGKDGKINYRYALARSSGFLKESGSSARRKEQPDRTCLTAMCRSVPSRGRMNHVLLDSAG